MLRVSNRLKRIYSVIIAFVVILVAGYLLFLTETFTHSQLELQQKQGTMELLQELFSEAGYYYYDEETEIYTVYDCNKSRIGYAFYAEGMSYEGNASSEGGKMGYPMVIWVGLKDIYTIENIVVMSHGEDQYYWNKLVNNGFFAQFTGLKIEDAYLIKAGGRIDSVTGATLSSDSVVDIVRESALEKTKFMTIS